MCRLGRRLEVGVFGGPSIIDVSRQLVKDVEYTETYPVRHRDVLAWPPAGDASKTGIGVHGGADVTWLLSRQIGVGGTVRYSRATVDLSTPPGLCRVRCRRAAGVDPAEGSGSPQGDHAGAPRLAPPRTAPPSATANLGDPLVAGTSIAVTTATAPAFF